MVGRTATSITLSRISRHSEWQLRWHEILNEFRDPDGGASATPNPSPDLDGVDRLHF